MALTTRGAKPLRPGRPVTTGYDTDALAQRFRAADSAGAGISPGAHSDPMQEIADQMKQGAQKAGSAISQGVGRLFGNRPTTPQEEQSYKLQGQKAYYNAKINKDYLKGD